MNQCGFAEWTIQLLPIPDGAAAPRPELRTETATFGMAGFILDGLDLTSDPAGPAWWLHRRDEPVRMGKTIHGAVQYIEYAQSLPLNSVEDLAIVELSNETETIAGFPCHNGILRYQGEESMISVADSLQADSIPDMLWMHVPGFKGVILRKVQQPRVGLQWVEKREVVHLNLDGGNCERLHIPNGASKVEKWSP